MEQNHKYLDLIIKLGILTAIIWFAFFKYEGNKIPQQYWQDKHFKTDTINIPIDYSKIKVPEFRYGVLPKIVLNYIDSSHQHIHVHGNDSLLTVIDSLKHRITKINAEYLKIYPKAAKILYGQFSGDSIRLDLLAIDGKVRSQIYLTNYLGFKYQYLSETNEFRAQKIKIDNPLRKELYVWGGYDLLVGKPQLGTDYSIYKGNLRLRALGSVYVSDKPQPSLGIGIGYKIK